MAFSKILVPFDGSVYSIKAFKVALDIAEKQKAQLHVLTCLEKDNLGAWYKDKRINKKIIQDARNYAKNQLQKLEEMSKSSDITIHIEETRSIAKKIVDFAKSKKINLIVIGSHGHSGFDRLILGSVSNKVSQLAKCPVLITR